MSNNYALGIYTFFFFRIILTFYFYSLIFIDDYLSSVSSISLLIKFCYKSEKTIFTANYSNIKAQQEELPNLQFVFLRIFSRRYRDRPLILRRIFSSRIVIDDGQRPRGIKYTGRIWTQNPRYLHATIYNRLVLPRLLSRYFTVKRYPAGERVQKFTWKTASGNC